MTWALREIPGTEHLHWYESQINRIFSNGHAMALCLYDKRLFAAKDLERIAVAHFGTVVPGTDRTWGPLLRMQRIADPPGLKLIGEADASNRDALAATLAGLFDNLPVVGDPVVLDLTELRFADTGAARLLAQAGDMAPRGSRMIGCSPSLLRLLELVSGEVITEAMA